MRTRMCAHTDAQHTHVSVGALGSQESSDPPRTGDTRLSESCDMGARLKFKSSEGTASPLSSLDFVFVVGYQLDTS